jgi:lipoprotein-anchoring transpeptidase ErfK/SrfK
VAKRTRALAVGVVAPAVWIASSLVGVAGASGSPCPAWTAAGSTLREAASTASVQVGPREALVSLTAHPAGRPVVLEYREPGRQFSCTAARFVGSGDAAVTISGLRPSSRYGLRVATKTQGAAAVGPLEWFTTLPSGRIAEGVRIGSIDVGRMSAEGAQRELGQHLVSSVGFTYAGAFWRASARALGATTNVRELVGRALDAKPGSPLPPATVSVNGSKLRGYAAGIARRFDQDANTASVRLVGTRAVVTPLRPVVRVDATALAAEIVHALNHPSTERIEVPVKKKAVASQAQQRAVVVRLGSQTLTAYLNGRAVLTTPVTTGRPALPTPIGSFHVESKNSPYVFHSPWAPGSAYWYPPTPVTWAMQFYGGDFLHDDPAEPTGDFGSDSENGYFASHGCVHVPHSAMAYLYDWLPLGAAVIVAES